MKRSIFQSLVTFFVVLAISGCTSLGHESRTTPQIAREVPEPQSRIVLISSAGSLSVSLERLLEARGIRVLALPDKTMRQPGARYTVTATSFDLDNCVPEGSRQMHFDIVVLDTMTNQRAFVLSGKYGCQGTILRAFETWLLSSSK